MKYNTLGHGSGSHRNMLPHPHFRWKSTPTRLRWQTVDYHRQVRSRWLLQVQEDFRYVGILFASRVTKWKGEAVNLQDQRCHGHSPAVRLCSNSFWVCVGKNMQFLHPPKWVYFTDTLQLLMQGAHRNKQHSGSSNKKVQPGLKETCYLLN